MDMSRYLDMFLEEAKDYLQNLNENLLSLEKDVANTALVDAIFRSAHTLKGMSATMGFDQIAELTHQMENVLQQIRSGERMVTSAVVDVLFKCLDALEGLVEAIAKGQEPNQDTSQLLQLLQQGQTTFETGNPQDGVSQSASANFATDLPLNEYEKSLISAGKARGFQAWQIRILLKPTCVMKSARSFMVFRNLEAMGEVIKTNPSIQAIEAEDYDQFFDVILLSQHSRAEIVHAVATIAELETPQVTPLEVNASSTDNSGTPVERKSSLSPKEPPSTIRVDTERLDSLMNLVGELVINKGRINQVAQKHGWTELKESLEQLGRISADLQNLVMKVRMVPVEQVFNRFPRMVRDLAKELDKDIQFVLEGKDTELDRTVIDEIGDPLVHLLRNSLDHGVESSAERLATGKSATAMVKLSAKHEGNRVIIEVTDDGRGIDTNLIRVKAVEKGIISQTEADNLTEEQAVNLIFAAGLSTSSAVTDISGRGVGMDAVRSKIESLNGEINIFTRPGEGTTFQIQLPLTLAIILALLVRVSEENYAIPLTFIDETTSITPLQIQEVEDQEVIILRGKVLPLVRLHNLVQLPTPDYAPDAELFVVVVRKGGRRIGILVDDLIGQREIVIKPLGQLLADIPGLSGATILGDGQVSLILDVSTLF